MSMIIDYVLVQIYSFPLLIYLNSVAILTVYLNATVFL